VPSSETARVAVITGATGFLGSHIARALLELGYQVRAVVRRVDASLPSVIEQVVVTGLDDRDALRKACMHVHVVYHLAGRAHVVHERALDPLARFREVNVDGTRVMAQAAADACVPVFVLMSSIAAGISPVHGEVSEDPECRPLTPYGISKREAEEVGAQIITAAGGRFVALRPPMIYGPGMKGNPFTLFRWLARGRPLPLGGIRARRSVAYVGNVVDAALFLGATDTAVGAYVMRDDEMPTVAEFVTASAHALGQRPHLIAFPESLLRLAGVVGDSLVQVVPVPFTSARLASLVDPLVIDTRRIRQLGFRPRTTMEVGLGTTARWFRGSVPP
jgi:UDP-glucose 4-epimerase